MVFFGPTSSVFDIATFALMWWMFSANTPANQGLFQSGWFVVGLLTQTLVVHMIRTPKLPFVQSRSSPALVVMTVAIMAAGIFLPMGPLAEYFKLLPLPLAYFPWLVGILVTYCALTTWMKRYYVRHFGWQCANGRTSVPSGRSAAVGLIVSACAWTVTQHRREEGTTAVT